MSFNGLAGKVAIVTGSAQGTGGGSVRRLAEEGCRVVAVDVKPLESRESPDTEHIFNIIADVSTEEGCRSFVRKAVERFGSVSFLVNNAGIRGIPAPITEVPVEDFDNVFGVNVRSVFLGMKFFLQQNAYSEYTGRHRQRIIYGRD